MEYEKIIKDVLQSMASGTGTAHSEDMLYAELLKQHPDLIESEHQIKIRKAIANLLSKGEIIHDPKMPMWICLKGR